MEQNQSQTQEVQETSLPKPQNNIEVVTATPMKKQRSPKQMEWSRELGRRSQEFKRKKYTMQNALVTSPPELSISKPPELSTNKPLEPRQSTGNNSSYLFYLFLIGGALAGGYYFIHKKQIIAPESQLVKPSQ